MTLRRIGIIIAAFGIAAASPAQAEDLLVTQYKNDPSGAPYGIALEKGFFKKSWARRHRHHLRGGRRQLGAQRHGDDLGYGDVTAAPVIAAADQGQDVKIVGMTSRSLADLVMIVMPNSPLKTPADIKGKKFGISNPKSLGEMMGVLVMEKAGLKQGDVQMTALGSLGGALTALENGVVDVTSIPLILFRTRGGESKYRVLVGPKDLPLIPSQLGMATSKAMKEWPDKLRAIQAARRDGTKFIYEHTDEAIKILSKVYAPLPPKDVGIMVKELVEAKFWSEGRIEMPLLETDRACDERRRHAGEGCRPQEHGRQLVPAGRSAKMTDRGAPDQDIHACALGCDAGLSGDGRHAAGSCARAGRSRSQARRVLRRGRPLRLRQVHAARGARRPAAADRRHGDVRGPAGRGRGAGWHRRRVSGGRQLSLADGVGQRRVRPAPQRRRPTPRCAAGSTTRWPSWD